MNVPLYLHVRLQRIGVWFQRKLWPESGCRWLSGLHIIVCTQAYTLIVLFGLEVCANAGVKHCWCTGRSDLDDHSQNFMVCKLWNGTVGALTRGIWPASWGCIAHG